MEAYQETLKFGLAKTGKIGPIDVYDVRYRRLLLQWAVKRKAQIQWKHLRRKWLSKVPRVQGVQAGAEAGERRAHLGRPTTS